MTLILNGSVGVSDVDGSAATPAIRGTDANTGMFFPAADTVAVSTGGTERMRIDSSGNVGIGTSSPSQKLTISDATAANILISGSTTNFITYAYSGFAVSGTTSNTPWLFYTNNTERARIDASGNLLVGTTDAGGSSGNGLKILPSGGVTGVYCVGSASTNSSNSYHVYSTGAGAFRFYVGYGGTVFATSTTITAISDQRLKENIRDIDVGLDAILSLKPRKFDWKAGKGKDKKGDRGWVAQEFEQVFPDMVDTWADPAPEGEEPYKAVNADLIPVLVKAIQELKAQNDELKARVDALNV